MAGTNSGLTPSILKVVELWDGTSWTETTDMSTARYGTAGAGTQPSALVLAGYDNSSWFNNTEEWTGAYVAASSMTSSK